MQNHSIAYANYCMLKSKTIANNANFSAPNKLSYRVNKGEKSYYHFQVVICEELHSP